MSVFTVSHRADARSARPGLHAVGADPRGPAWSSCPGRGSTYVTDTPGPRPDSPTIVLLHALGCTGLLTWYPVDRAAVASGSGSSPSTSAGTAAASSREEFSLRRLRRRRRRADRRARPRATRSSPATRWARSSPSGSGASTPTWSAGLVLVRDHRPVPADPGASAFFHAGMERRRCSALRGVSRSRTAVRAPRGRPPTRSTSSPTDIHEWALARVAQHQPVGGRPGRRRARPAPLAAVAARASTYRPRSWSPSNDKVIPPARQRRAGPPDPRRDHPRHRRRPRRVRAGGRDVRAGVRRGGRTVNARRRDFRSTARRSGLRRCGLSSRIGRRLRASSRPPALQLRPSSAGKRWARSSTSGIDSRQAMIPTCTWPLLDITVMLRPAPWKTGPSG